MNAVDTNVLIYVHDPRHRDKQATAAALLQSMTEGVLLWQVACEYLAASRKLEPFGYSCDQAWQDIRDFRRVWTTSLPSWRLLERAERLLGSYSLSFWDAMIIAACLEGGVTRLYSDSYQEAEGNRDKAQGGQPSRSFPHLFEVRDNSSSPAMGRIWLPVRGTLPRTSNR
jgi:predicted nucleic acid-binding protein